MLNYLGPGVKLCLFLRGRSQPFTDIVDPFVLWTNQLCLNLHKIIWRKVCLFSEERGKKDANSQRAKMTELKNMTTEGNQMGTVSYW